MSTSIWQANDSYVTNFTITSATGALVNADSLPAGALYRNGPVDGAVTVTVTNQATGIYSAACTIPVGYAIGDKIDILITATISSIATGAIIDRFRLTGFPNNAFPNAATGTAGAVLTSGTGTAQLSTTSGGANINLAQGAAAFRDLTAVTAPTLGDELNAAFMEFQCPEVLPGSQNTTSSWTKQIPGTTNPARTFTTGLDSSGNVISRS
jgi:hypothetical protein